MPENNVVLEVKDLRIRFGGAQPLEAVKGISFSLQQGKTLALVGESGSGKSLTAYALMGLQPKEAVVEGAISLNSSDAAPISLVRLAGSEWQTIRGNRESMVFQEPMSALNPVMQIGRQLSESILAHQNLSKEAAKNLAIDWLRRVQLPNPETLYHRYPHQLSGGQKQRVVIAMALCNKPALVIADEPTTALDVTVQQEVVGLMRELQKDSETALLFITHDLALASEIADEMLVLYRGEVVEYGPASQVLHHPKMPYTKALIACRPAAQQKGVRLPVVADFLDADKARSDAAVVPKPAPAVPVENKVLLQVKDLRIWFPERKGWLGKGENFFKAVDGVSLELRKGEVLGLVGESGCGKSTLSRALMGLVPVKSGEILFDGDDLATLKKSDWTRIRRKIQMVFQDPFSSLNPRMTVGEAIAEPMMAHRIHSPKEAKKETLRLLDLVQLPADAAQRYPHQFSGGQRQRIGIARALGLRPQILVCDESVSALDVSVQAQILNLLKDLQAEFDLSYLFISHDLSVVHYIADRVMVMQKGVIVEEGAADAVLKSPQQAYTQRLVAAMPELLA